VTARLVHPFAYPVGVLPFVYQPQQLEAFFLAAALVYISFQ
jgi:hypothetical protein